MTEHKTAEPGGIRTSFGGQLSAATLWVIALTDRPANGATQVSSAGTSRSGPGELSWRLQANPVRLLGYLVGHILLGLAMEASTAVGLVAGVAVIGAAVAVVLSARHLAPLVWLAAYVGVYDVLWRQVMAPVPWEAAKYLLAAVGVAGIVRFTGWMRQSTTLVVLVSLLVPGMVITAAELGLSAVRDPFSFNLAGYLALFFCVAFFSRVQASWEEIQTVLWIMLGPIFAIAAVSTQGTVGLDASAFEVAESVSTTSGGFGPNQVSAQLGLGVLLCGWLVVLERRMFYRIIAGVSMLWLIGQSALTFSRGGLVNVVVATVVALPYLLRLRQAGGRLIAGGLVVGVALIGVVLPALQDVTGGAVQDRFTSSSTTGRDELLQADLQMFRLNPLTGVGAGLGVQARLLGDKQVAAHTEYTRLLAEHGLFGAGVILAMGALAWRAVKSKQTVLGRAFALSMMGWVGSEMIHSAMRVATISLVFGLAFLMTSTPQRAALRTGGRGSDGDRSDENHASFSS